MTAPVFYFDFASPYAYLSALRMGEVLPGARWRPIYFAALLRHSGRRPWSFEADRDAHFAEINRRATRLGLPPLRYPEGWPLTSNTIHALRGATVAEDAGRLPEFARAMFGLHLGAGQPLSEERVVTAGASVGLEVAHALRDEAVKGRVRQATDEAIARGVQGIPTVAVGDTLYWGDDRLEDAAAAVAV